MKTSFCLAFLAFGLAAGSAYAGFVPRLPHDPNFVQLSPRCSFYVISVDSSDWLRLGFANAPVVEPSRFNQGNGVDVVAIPFDRTGRVAFAPVYIYTVRPEGYRLRKMRGLVQGYTTKADVKELLGETPDKRQMRGYELWYYEYRVNNPFEESPSDSQGH